MSRIPRHNFLLLLALGLLVPTAALADPYQDVLISLYPADEPGAAVLVARGDRVLYTGASGMADLELGVPLTPDDVFELGSITKQFTASLVMRQVEAGKLALSDPLTRFFPDYPHGDSITVENLLTHTSGIKNYTDLPRHMAQEIRKDISVPDLIAVFRDEPMNFTPGSQWSYSNSGYILLGAILEQVTGTDYETLVETTIFEPLGMGSSRYGNTAEIIPRRAQGYSNDGQGGFTNARYLSMTQPYAAGSLMSTVNDMFRWNRALFGGKVVSKASLTRMTTPFVLTTGDTTVYGFGLGVSDIRGHRSIEHGGGIFGFTTHGAYVPDADIYVVVLTNQDGTKDPGLLAHKLAAQALGDPYPVLTAVTLTGEQMGRAVGVYRIDDANERWVMPNGDGLGTKRTGGGLQDILAASGTRFFYPNSLTWFDLVVKDGKVTGMEMHQGGADKGEFAEKVADDIPEQATAHIDPAMFDAYVGDYELTPEFILTVYREGDRFWVQATGQPAFELFPESATAFFLKAVDARIEFHKDDGGAVTELVLFQGGQEMPAPRK